MADLKSFYGLSFNPFDKNTLKPENAFLSIDQKTMMNRLTFLKEARGIGVFTASSGLGKSYSLRCFDHSLNKNLFVMLYICLTTVTVSEFYKQLCTVLGVEPGGGKSRMFRAIQESISRIYKDQRKHLILAIDEAQYLSTSVLNDLKMLMNFNYDSLNCFTLILSGEPYLNETLSKQIHDALAQRITVHYTFMGLTKDEVPEYVRHKIRSADGADSIIGEDAITAVTGYCNGNPRKIDNIMSGALTWGADAGSKVIDADIILKAVNERALV